MDTRTVHAHYTLAPDAVREYLIIPLPYAPGYHSGCAQHTVTVYQDRTVQVDGQFQTREYAATLLTLARADARYCINTLDRPTCLTYEKRWCQEQCLDYNRLVFARWLIQTGRCSDN